MAEITITVSGSTGLAPTWTPFNHAALVAAGRSRADGLDFYMRHTSGTPVVFFGRSGLNTSSCYVDFKAIANTVGDTGYRLGFGDLGWQTDRASATMAAVSGTATPSVPSVALPDPGYVVEIAPVFDSGALSFPEYASVRARARSENEREVLAVNWNNVSPEDWYEVRAFVRAYGGGAATFAAPSWISGGGTWRIVPGSYAGAQFSRRGYRASLSLERIAA